MGGECSKCYNTLCVCDEIYNSKKPVYCINCKWIREYGHHEFTDHECIHPSNVIEKRTWYNPYNTFKKSPRKLNKNNDCENYCDGSDDRNSKKKKSRK